MIEETLKQVSCQSLRLKNEIDISMLLSREKFFLTECKSFEFIDYKSSLKLIERGRRYTRFFIIYREELGWMYDIFEHLSRQKVLRFKNAKLKRKEGLSGFKSRKTKKVSSSKNAYVWIMGRHGSWLSQKKDYSEKELEISSQVW